MELRILRYFLAVVREENISRAAERLYVTQPTLSRQMAQLEEELGAQLFVRGKRLVLTDAGRMLRHRAEEMVQLADKIGEEFQTRQEVAGEISIGMGGLYATRALMAHITQFRALYPRVQFQFYTSHADDIKARLDSGLLDFGLLLEPIEIEKYDYLRMKSRERWGVLMRADHPLAQQAGIGREDLAGLPLVTTARMSLQKEIANWLQADFSRLDIFGTYNIITNVAELVNQGAVCALTIEGAVNLFAGERLVFRPLSPELSMTSVLAWQKFNPAFGTAGKFLQSLKACILSMEEYKI